jgi:hypothetical protein
MQAWCDESRIGVRGVGGGLEVSAALCLLTSKAILLLMLILNCCRLKWMQATIE